MNSSYIKCAVAALVVFSAIPTTAYSQNDRSPVIVLDPGHGGKDPGAIGKKFKEKNAVLNVALKLGKMLKDSVPGIKVLYTRDKDVFVPLDKRAEVANSNSADLFLSIHANASKNRSIYGAETFVMGLHKSKDNLDVAQRENAAIHYEENYSDKYADLETSIMTGLVQSTNLEWSAMAASRIQSSLVKCGRTDRGLKQAGFLVLWRAAVPSILVELGFISNADDEAYMTSDEGSTAIAASMCSAVKQYLQDRLGRGKVTYEEPKPQVEKKAEVKEQWPAGVNFRVQVVVSSKERTIDAKGHKPVTVIKDDGKMKYMVGLTTNFDEIEKVKESLKESFPDCFIVAFDGKEKISVRSARRQLKK